MFDACPVSGFKCGREGTCGLEAQEYPHITYPPVDAVSKQGEKTDKGDRNGKDGKGDKNGKSGKKKWYAGPDRNCPEVNLGRFGSSAAEPPHQQAHPIPTAGPRQARPRAATTVIRPSVCRTRR
jgi:hypothetical protein